MGNHNSSIGKIGEDYAAQYLIDYGYSIISRHYTCRWGELDIIARKSGIIVFVEVKTRTSTRQGSPYEAVHAMKVRRLSRAIQYFILERHLHKAKYQLDVVSVLLDTEMNVSEIRRYENVLVSGVY